MSTDRLKHVAIALVGLIFLWGAVEILRPGMDAGAVAFNLPAAGLEQTDSIVIHRANDTLVLAKTTDTEWTINGRDAGYGFVSDLFSAMQEDVSGQLIAENAATHARLEVDDTQGRRMRIWSADSLTADIVVGKRGRDFQSAYFRRPDEDAVYLVRSRLVAMVDRQVNDWRDRNIAAVESDSVVAVEVVRGGERYALRRGDSTWTFASGEPADSGAVDRLLGQFRALSATGFPRPEQEDSVDFEAPERRVVLRGPGGEAILELMFDSSATSVFWTRRADESTVFQLIRSRVEQLTPADSTLRADVSGAG